MTIKLLGQGSLYEINRNKPRWEIRRQRRITVALVAGILASIATLILLWTYYLTH
jgi:hypothetical protein